MATSDSNLLDDMAYAEAEGAADMTGGPEDDMDLFGGEADGEGYEDDAYAPDALEDDFGYFSGEGNGMEADEAEQVVTQALGSALAAESEDEFFGKLISTVKKVAQNAAPIIGKIARGAAPLLNAIPLPHAKVAGQVAGLLGKLRAEGGTVADALEAVAEVAARSPLAVPVVAGLAARSVAQNGGASMPPAQRQQVARAMTQAAASLVRGGGPQAIRALPKIARSVRRTTAANGTPPAMRPQVLARTAAKVARNPQLLHRLSAPSPEGQRLAASAGNGRMGGIGGGGASRHLNVRGPATITISVR